MKLLRALIARLDSWVRFPDFERLDDLYDVWDDDPDPDTAYLPADRLHHDYTGGAS